MNKEAENQEPVAWMFQHDETGRMTFVETQQIEWGWEKNNPRYTKIGPLYTTPQQRTWVELTKQQYDDIYASNKDNIYRAMMVVATYLKRKNT